MQHSTEWDGFRSVRQLATSVAAHSALTCTDNAHKNNVGEQRVAPVDQALAAVSCPAPCATSPQHPSAGKAVQCRSTLTTVFQNTDTKH